jgi:hypothetical protein
MEATQGWWGKPACKLALNLLKALWGQEPRGGQKYPLRYWDNLIEYSEGDSKAIKRMVIGVKPDSIRQFKESHKGHN